MYLHLVDFDGKLVGKYISPMDPLGGTKKQKSPWKIDVRQAKFPFVLPYLFGCYVSLKEGNDACKQEYKYGCK